MAPPSARFGRGAVCLLALVLIAAPLRRTVAELPKGTITDVQILGNDSVPVEDIKRKILSRAGRELDPATVETDYRELMGSKWFSDVQISYQKDPKKADGVILVFHVKEMPILKKVEFRGRSKIKLKTLEEDTGLKVGNRADSVKAQLAVRQIKRLYEEQGYDQAEVKLIKGGKPGDTEVVFEIFEGDKNLIRGVTITGNQFVSDALLQTKISTRRTFFGLGGRFDKDLVEEDARKLRQFYQGLGFFEVKVTYIVRPGATIADHRLEFVIWEGPQYKVRNIAFEGEKLIDEKTLRAGLVLHSGQAFSDTVFEADRKNLEGKYGEIGCIDAQIEVDRKYVDPLKQPGVVDLLYKVHEGEPYVLGDFLIKGNERTKRQVLTREAEMAGLVPGEPLNMKRVKMYEQRLKNLRYFTGADPKGGGKKPIEIKLVNRRPHDQPYGQTPTVDLDEVIRTRMQSPGPEFPADSQRIGQARPRPSRAATMRRPRRAAATVPRRWPRRRRRPRRRHRRRSASRWRPVPERCRRRRSASARPLPRPRMSPFPPLPCPPRPSCRPRLPAPHLPARPAAPSARADPPARNPACLART